MYLVFIITLLYLSPVYAQDIPQENIEKRIQNLEQEKIKLENIYKEITIRIDELKILIQPKEEKKEELKDKD